jgi:hypothetical protein
MGEMWAYGPMGKWAWSLRQSPRTIKQEETIRQPSDDVNVLALVQPPGMIRHEA